MMTNGVLLVSSRCCYGVIFLTCWDFVGMSQKTLYINIYCKIVFYFTPSGKIYGNGSKYWYCPVNLNTYVPQKKFGLLKYHNH